MVMVMTDLIAAATCMVMVMTDPCRRHRAVQVRALWLSLLNEAEEVDWSLEDTKAKFSETTRQQVVEFSAHTAELWERFRTSGPGLPTVELVVGLDELHKYEASLQDALRQREQLVLAEKLFNMPITAYPELAQQEAEIRKLGQVWAGTGGTGRPGGAGALRVGKRREGRHARTGSSLARVPVW
jgi:hypothetical protein